MQRTMSTISVKLGAKQIAVLRELYLLMEPASIRDLSNAMAHIHYAGRMQYKINLNEILSSLISRHLVFRSPPNYRCRQPSSRIETYGITTLGTRVLKQLQQRGECQ